MTTTHASTGVTGRTGGALLVLLALSIAGCEAERDEVPEIGEIEAELEEDEIDVELDEERVLGPGDVGETFFMTGWITGDLVPGGFFLRTEGGRVVFIESDEPVQLGGVVRATGVLRAADVAVFEGWEADAFDDDLEADWEVERSYYLDATTVVPMAPGAIAPLPEGDAPAGTDADSAGAVPADTSAGTIRERGRARAYGPRLARGGIDR